MSLAQVYTLTTEQHFIAPVNQSANQHRLPSRCAAARQQQNTTNEYS